RAFSIRKLMKEDVARHIIAVLRQFDVCLLVEVRDPQETVEGQSHTALFSTLLGQLNHSASGSARFDCAVSRILGKSTVHREKLAYVYRADLLTLQRTLNLDGFSQEFERVPFAAKFRLRANPHFEFTLLGAHLKPDNAVAEMAVLGRAYEHAKWRFSG